MIRRATEDDLYDLGVMAEKFHKRSGMPGTFDFETALNFGQQCIDNPSALVLRSNKGMILGAIMSPFYDPNWVMAVELIWYAEDASGIRLLKAFEYWAKENNADEVRLSSINHIGDAVDRYATKRGGVITERSYSIRI
jgi:cell division protein FtsI/penicillin-binding protein 2